MTTPFFPVRSALQLNRRSFLLGSVSFAAAENPVVKYHNNERGYVRCEVTPKQWKTDYRTVPFVSRRGAPLTTRATYVVEAGRPQLNRA